MKTEELKNIQAPIKEEFRKNPQSAMLTLSAEGVIGDNISCKIDTGKKMVEAGLHKITGGNGMMACSGDLLLEALVACAGVTLNAVATSIGINLKSGKVIAEGDLDFRGTMAVSKEAPVGFSAIRLKFELDSNHSEEEISKLISLTERYCVVYQTLVRPTSVETSYRL